MKRERLKMYNIVEFQLKHSLLVCETFYLLYMKHQVINYLNIKRKRKKKKRLRAIFENELLKHHINLLKHLNYTTATLERIH